MNNLTMQPAETRKAFLLLPVLLASLLVLTACAGMDKMGDEMSGNGTGTDTMSTDTASGASGTAGDGSAAGDEAGDITASVPPGTEQDLEINVGDRVFFATDSSELTEQSQTTLQRQAEWLRRYPEIRVRIEGHADERGTREYNLGLGQRRANQTREYLISLGIDGGRLSTISYGKERPLALCSNENCWKQNRRAVTTVVAPGS